MGIKRNPTLEQLIGTLTERSEKIWEPTIPDITISPIARKQRQATQLHIDESNQRQGRSEKYSRKTVNATWLGNYFSHIGGAYYGGIVLSKVFPHSTSNGNKITHPDIVIAEKLKVLESKGANHKFEAQLKHRQMHDYVAAQISDPQSRYIYIVFRHGWGGVLSEFTGGQTALYNELATSLSYCVEFPVSVIFSLWQNDSKACRLAPYTSKEGEKLALTNPEQALNQQILCLKAPFFQELIRSPYDTFRVVTEEIGNNFEVRHRLLQNLRVGGVSTQAIPLIRIIDRNHAASVQYLKENAGALMEGSTKRGQELSSKAQISMFGEVPF